MKITESQLRKIVKESIIETLNEITAYHGGKVKFNQFSNDYFRTGYGACKYGEGVYVTVNKDTAGHYATGLDGVVKAKNGFVYTVEIPDNDGTNYIIWNRPIGEAVYEKIKDYWYDDYQNRYTWNISPQTTGEQIYQRMADRFGRADFHVFEDYGIIGVMVPDTTQQANLINYIIFDAKNVKILQTQTAQMNGDRQYQYGNVSENKKIRRN